MSAARIAVALLLSVFGNVACTEIAPIEDKLPAEKRAFVINTDSGCLAGICIGMRENQLLALGFPITRRTVFLEGDEYTMVDVSVTEGLAVEVLLVSGKVERFATASHFVRDERGMGVGRVLGDLKQADERSVLVFGYSDGPFVNVVNGTRVVFQLEQGKFAPECFDSGFSTCSDELDAKIVRVIVHSGVASISE